MHTVDLRRPRRFVTACAAVAALTWLAPQHVSAEVANPGIIPSNCAYIVSVPDTPAFWSAWEGNALYGSYKKVMESDDIQEKTANFRKELGIIESSLGFKIDGKTLSSIFGSADAYFVPRTGKPRIEGVAILKITDEDKLNKLIDLAEKAAMQAAAADDESTDTESTDKSTSGPIQESEYQGVAIKAYEFEKPNKSAALEDEDDDEDEDDRRDVDTAEIGHDVADRPQCRLGYPIEEVSDGPDRLVTGVDHVEGDQPRQHCRGDQEPDVELEGEQNDVDEGAHVWISVGPGKADSSEATL